MEKSLEKIGEILNRELPKLKSEYNVSTLEIFGSFVRNEQIPGSDLDVLVTFTSSSNLFQNKTYNCFA